MFGDPAESLNMQFPLVQDLVSKGVFEHRLSSDGKKCFGSRFQRLLYADIPIDIFCCFPPSQWGVLSVIRTGPALFSKALITQRCEGGKYLPTGMRVQDGRVIDRGVPVETPEEEDFFKLLGLPYIHPEDRKVQA